MIYAVIKVNNFKNEIPEAFRPGKTRKEAVDNVNECGLLLNRFFVEQEINYFDRGDDFSYYMVELAYHFHE